MQTTKYEELPKRSRYYQDIIDLNLIEKGEAYDILNTSYVIFICTFDFFKSNKVCMNLKIICINKPELKLNDGTHKIFLNTKEDRSGISKELKLLLDYFDDKEPESKLAKKIDKKVFEAKRNDQWRREYMSYQMELNQQYRNGKEEGRKEGQKESIVQLVTRKYQLGDSPEKIAKDLLMSEEEVEEILGKVVSEKVE